MITPFNAHHKDYPAYRQKCAEIMGHKPCRLPLQSKDDPIPRGWSDSLGREGWKAINRLPTYLDDASIDAVVRKLDDEQLPKYSKHLALVILGKVACMYYETDAMLQATPEQKAEALYRTLMGGREGRNEL